MRFAPSLILLVAIAADLRVADASCGGPSTWLSPSSGAPLPPFPTIYLFDTDHEANILDLLTIQSRRGVELRYRAAKLASAPQFNVHRIEVRSASLGDGPIEIHWKGERLATYPIAEPTEHNAAKVVDVTFHERYWTCSFENEIQVAVEGNAIAYQIEWDDDRTTVVSGENAAWSGPRDRDMFVLGHPNCMFYNVERELLATPRSFELYALFADGAVKRMGSSIAQLQEHGTVRLPVELMKGADVRFPRKFSVAVATSPHWIFATGGVGGLAGGLVVFWTGRKRRRIAEAERLAAARLVSG